jgi:hypothetical protein
MDYLNDAFGGLAPRKDKDGAIKFCLNVILKDDEIDRLVELLSVDSKIIAIEGQPSWTLERRNERASAAAYAAWPKNAQFRAYVDPDGYELAFPEGFYDLPTFQQFVSTAMRAYKARNPERTSSANQVLSLVSPR